MKSMLVLGLATLFLVGCNGAVNDFVRSVPRGNPNGGTNVPTTPTVGVNSPMSIKFSAGHLRSTGTDIGNVGMEVSVGPTKQTMTSVGGPAAELTMSQTRVLYQ